MPHSGAEHHVSAALAMEVPIQPFPTADNGALSQGIIDSTSREQRTRRRELAREFWQE
jgi:hypothetical protein